MNKILILSFSFFLLPGITMSSWSTELNGVTIKDNMELDGTSLERNGHGFRQYVGFLSYVGQLFAKKRSSYVSEVLDPEEPLAFQIDITDVEKPELTLQSLLEEETDAKSEGVDESARSDEEAANGAGKDGGEAEICHQKEIKKVLGQIVSNFPEPLKSKDTFVISYTAEKGITVSRNDETPCEPVKGSGVKMGLFGNWVGPKAVDPAFSDALLSMEVADDVKGGNADDSDDKVLTSVDTKTEEDIEKSE